MKGLFETMETECDISSKAFRLEDTSALLLNEETARNVQFCSCNKLQKNINIDIYFFIINKKYTSFQVVKESLFF